MREAGVKHWGSAPGPAPTVSVTFSYISLELPLWEPPNRVTNTGKKKTSGLIEWYRYLTTLFIHKK